MEITGTSTESSNKRTEDFLTYMENFQVAPTTGEIKMERVPLMLRSNSSYENCYNPSIVSIGPYHHGKGELQTFEDLKFSIALDFCRSYVGYTSHTHHVSSREIYKSVENVGKNAQECYEKGSTEGYDSGEFNRMMFLDGCFVLYCIFRFLGVNRVANEGQKELDANLYKYQTPVLRDLFLLENQIPLVVLNVLMNYRYQNSEDKKNLILNFLRRTTMLTHSSTNYADMEVDLEASPHLLHLRWEQMTKPNMHTIDSNRVVTRNIMSSWVSDRTISELKRAGIHFKPSLSGNVTDIEFKSHFTSGTLTLPQMKVDDSTKPSLLNLVAYEMCPNGPSESPIASYICLIDSLIDTADDVQELRRKGVIFNYLSSDLHLAELFNEISTNLTYGHMYRYTLSDLGDHYKRRRHVWMAECMDTYFTSPWALMAFLAAVLALALTATQTYFTIFPRK